MQKKKPEENINVVLTGGHAATTALAVIDEILLRKLPWKLYWLGSKFAIEGRKVTTLEYRILPGSGVTFVHLITGRLQRRFTFWTIPSLIKIPAGFVQAFYLLIKIKPRLVLSFGGFSSFPVVLTAKILGIPVIIHEQTSAAGRANLASINFADRIALSRKENEKYFPVEKSIITGNPVSKRTFLVKPKKNLSHPPVILVTGGSRGSQKINSVVGEVLPKLLNKYKLIHLTGEIDLGKFNGIKGLLPPDLKVNYEVFGSVEPGQMINFYEKADLIISRAGANTVSEILAVKRPAVIIPLPISYLDEQTQNAKILEKAGYAKIIPQDKLTGANLIEAIDEIFLKYQTVLDKINKFKSSDDKAAGKLVDLLKEYI